jgi:hypothetical protein
VRDLIGVANNRFGVVSVAAIPDKRQSGSDRFVDPREYEKEAD